MKTYLALTVFLLLNVFARAQDFMFGSLEPEDIKLDKNDLDSFSNAAVLNEFGKAYMIFNDTKGRTELILEYHVRTKLFNRDGYDQANIVVPLYRDESGERADDLSEIRAETINVVDGRIVRTPVDKRQVFKENVSKYVTLTKFTFPDLREGSIIEYSYRLVSPDLFNFRTWQLQDKIPKINSRFEALIPGLYTYNVVLRGPYPLTTQDAKLNSGCFRIAGRDIDCSHMTYGMTNIPAFVEEDYMTAASNFKSAIYFELSDIYRLNGSNLKITKNWKDVDRELISDPRFGGQLKRDNVFKDLLPNILNGATDDLSKAKAVYRYIQKNIKWNRYRGKYSENTIKNALEKRSGNTGDINLALIAGLRAAGLDAEAVILSTRDNGLVNDVHPVISDFNYVAAKVNIGDETFLLDASDPLLPFGLLPLHCINGKARVINLKSPSYWIEPKSSQRSITQYALRGELVADGTLNGTLEIRRLGYAAHRKRQELTEYNSFVDYLERVGERNSSFQIEGGEVQGDNDVDSALVETFQVTMKLFNGLEDPELFFNPFFLNRIGKNPFNLDERTYPVDMGAAREERVLLSVRIPAGYALKSAPRDYNLALENNGGRYLTQTTLSDNVLSFNQLLTLNQAIYPPEGYFALKEFFSRIIQQEKVDIVLHNTSAK